MDVYIALTFDNSEDFEVYRNTIQSKNLGYTLDKETLKDPKNPRITVLIKTEFPIPSGLLTVKTNTGREIKIHVASGPFISNKK